MITTKALTQRFNGKAIYENLNVTIKENCFTVLLGKNGSGKSTLLKTILTLLKQSEGEIFIDEKLNTDYKRKESSELISYLAQKSDVFAPLSVKEVVVLSSYKKNCGNLQETLRLFELEEIQNRNFLTLSGGEMQKVLIARTIYQGTPIILLDEILNNLDSEYQEKLFKTLKQLQKERKLTIFAVMHDLLFTQYIAEEVILLREGKILASGEAKVVLTKANLEETFSIKFEEVELKGKKLLIPSFED